MNKRFSLLLGGIFLVTTTMAQPVSRAGDVVPSNNYEADWSTVLANIVMDEGTVRYDVLAGEQHERFLSTLKSVETFNATKLNTDAEKRAFWINAYNIQMAENILQNAAVQDIIADGFSERFFKTPLLTANGSFSLDDIENKILRKQSDDPGFVQLQPAKFDPRIHVGLNCAAVSCPRLRKRAFTAENLDEMLDEAMSDFVNDPRHFRVEKGQFVLSSLLDWFGGDFNTFQPAGDFLLKYMLPTRNDYDAFKALFEGKTAEQIKKAPFEEVSNALTGKGSKTGAVVRFEYRWPVNRAKH